MSACENTVIMNTTDMHICTTDILSKNMFSKSLFIEINYLRMHHYLKDPSTIRYVQGSGCYLDNVSPRSLNSGHEVADRLFRWSVVEVVGGDNDFEVVWFLAMD